MAMPVGNAIEHDASARATTSMLCTNSTSRITQADSSGRFLAIDSCWKIFPKEQLESDATSRDDWNCGSQDTLQLWAGWDLLGKSPPGARAKALPPKARLVSTLDSCLKLSLVDG